MDGPLLLSLRGVALLSRVRPLAWAAAWVASLPRLLGVLDRDRLVDGEALPARSSCLAGPGTKRQAGRCSLSFLALSRWCLLRFFFLAGSLARSGVRSGRLARTTLLAALLSSSPCLLSSVSSSRSASHQASLLSATLECTTPGRSRMLGRASVPPGAKTRESASAHTLSFPEMCLKTSSPYLLHATSRAVSRTMRLIGGDGDEPFAMAPSADKESDLVTAVARSSAQNGSHVLVATNSASASHVACADEEPTSMLSLLTSSSWILS